MPSTQATVGNSVGRDVGAAVVGLGEGGGDTVVGSAVGNGVGQVVPMKSLPVVTLQLATLLERAWTSVGTSAQSLFERRSKSKL